MDTFRKSWVLSFYQPTPIINVSHIQSSWERPGILHNVALVEAGVVSRPASELLLIRTVVIAFMPSLSIHMVSDSIMRVSTLLLVCNWKQCHMLASMALKSIPAVCMHSFANNLSITSPDIKL